MRTNSSISLIGYGPRACVECFSCEINDYLVNYSLDHQIRFFDIFKRKYNESNPDCFKKSDKLTFDFTSFAEKTFWGFSHSTTKDEIFNAAFASLEMKAVDFSTPYYKRGELIDALKRMDIPEDKGDYPNLIRMEISYKAIPILNDFRLFRCTIWFFEKTIEELKPLWMRMVNSLDKRQGNCFHSAYLSDNPYPFSILHSDSFDRIIFEDIADHILGIEKYTYLNKSLIKSLFPENGWSTAVFSSLENGFVFSFNDQAGIINCEDTLSKRIRSILISGYRSLPLDVLLSQKYYFSFPVTVCVLSEMLAVPCYGVYLFYGSFSKEDILEIIPAGPERIIDVFKLDKR